MEGGGTPEPGVVHRKVQRSDQQCESDISGESQSSLDSVGTRARSQRWLSDGAVGEIQTLESQVTMMAKRWRGGEIQTAQVWE